MDSNHRPCCLVTRQRPNTAARLSWHLTQYFVIRRGIVAKILCPQFTTHCGLNTLNTCCGYWLLVVAGSDYNTVFIRKVYFTINGVMTLWMYTSTHIVVEDAAVWRVIPGGQEVDGEECRHSPSAWSGWHQSLIYWILVIRRQSGSGDCIGISLRIITVGEAGIVSAVTCVNYAVKRLRCFQSNLKERRYHDYVKNLAKNSNKYTQTLFSCPLKFLANNWAKLYIFLKNMRWESYTNQGKCWYAWA